MATSPVMKKTPAASGIRQEPVGSLLPPPQVKESYDLTIIKDEPPSTRSVVAPNYQAMAVGDIAILTVEHLRDGVNIGIPTVRVSLNIEAAHMGQPLQWQVDKIKFITGVAGVKAYLSYAITHESSETLTNSAVQAFTAVVDGEPEFLAPAGLKGFDEGDLDPADWQSGIVLAIPAYTGMQPGDDLLVYMSDTDAVRPVVNTLRLDMSTVNTGLIEVRIEHAWLEANNGADVTFQYQYARLGKAGTGAPFTVHIAKTPNLPKPVVTDADMDIDGTATIRTERLYEGATIQFAVGTELNGGEAYMYWSHDFFVPIGDDGKFHIPKANIPFHLDKHLDVYYKVSPQGGGTSKPSAYLDLHVLAPNGGWPQLQKDGNYPIPRNVPATFRLDEWLFFAPGQHLRIRFTGQANSMDKVHDTRVGSREKLTDAEFSAKRIAATVPVDFLQSLDRGSPVIVAVHVSYDGGHHYLALPFVTNNMEG